ncbi:phage portal protein, partial [Vibrio splendidus]
MTEQTTEIISKESANDESLMFSFGEPEIMDRDFTNYEYNELYYNEDGKYWEPPLDRAGLNKLTRANAYHGSI